MKFLLSMYRAESYYESIELHRCRILYLRISYNVILEGYSLIYCFMKQIDNCIFLLTRLKQYFFFPCLLTALLMDFFLTKVLFYLVLSKPPSAMSDFFFCSLDTFLMSWWFHFLSLIFCSCLSSPFFFLLLCFSFLAHFFLEKSFCEESCG